MAMVSFPGGFYYPNPAQFGASGSNPAVGGAISVNSATAKLAWIVQCPKAGTLASFEVRTNSYTQATNGVRYSFQDIDGATGFPDGVVDQFATRNPTWASATWGGPGADMTSDGTPSGTKRTVAQGEWIGCVLDMPNWVSGNAVSFSTGFSLAVNEHLFNYVGNGTTGTYAMSASGGHLALKYDDGTYATWHLFANMGGLTTINSRVYNLNTAVQDEWGMAFTLPFDCKVDGGWTRLGIAADLDIVLYRASDNATLTSLFLDGTIKVNAAGVNTPFIFPDTVTLEANTEYIITARPSTTTSITSYSFTVTSALMETTPGGAAFYEAGRLNLGSTWTRNTANKPCWAIHVAAVDLEATIA